MKKPTDQVIWLKIVHIYNAIQSAVMGYNPHYLMFGCRPKLPVDFYFLTLRCTEGPRRGISIKHVDEYVATVWDQLRATLSRGPGPVYGRGSQTEMVLQLENRHHRFEAWQSCPNQGRHFSREEEDLGQMGRQVSWGSMSDHDRYPLIWSERPAWKFMHLTSLLAPPHCIRSWCSPACGCLPSMGWRYQSHASHAYCQREWQQDNYHKMMVWWSPGIRLGRLPWDG